MGWGSPTWLPARSTEAFPSMPFAVVCIMVTGLSSQCVILYHSLTRTVCWQLQLCRSISCRIYYDCCCSLQAGLIEANGELKVFIDQNLSPGKGKGVYFGNTSLLTYLLSLVYLWIALIWKPLVNCGNPTLRSLLPGSPLTWTTVE